MAVRLAQQADKAEYAKDFIILQHRAEVMAKFLESEYAQVFKDVAQEIIGDVLAQFIRCTKEQHDELKGAYHGMIKIINIAENIITEEKRQRENARPWTGNK